MEEAITRAIEGGWKPIPKWIEVKYINDEVVFVLSRNTNGYDHFNLSYKEVVVDPLFWQALGKSLGWEGSKFYPYDETRRRGEMMSEAKWYSRCFWNHLWEGKDIDSFFTSLLSTPTTKE